MGVSLVALAAALAAAPALADTLNLTTTDSTGSRTSFGGLTVGSTYWPAGAGGQVATGPAVAGNNYVVGSGLILRSTTAGYTFLGDSLKLDGSTFYMRGADGTTQNFGTLLTVGASGAGIWNISNSTSQTLAGTKIQLDGTVNLSAAGTGRVLTVSAPIQGTGGVTVATGVGTVILSNPGNTYTGDTTVQTGGLLQMGAGGALPTNSAMPNALKPLASASGNLVNSGTFRLAGSSTTINGLSGVGTVDDLPASGGSAAAAQLTVLGNTSTLADITFSGKLTNGTGGGVLSLEKSGLADPLKTTRQIISGTANDYTGTTKVSDGQLRFVGAGSLGTGAVTVSSGAGATPTNWGTLELSGVGSKGNAVTLDGRTSNTVAHINSLAGANVLSGGLGLGDNVAETTENYNIVSSGVVSGDKLTISGVGITRVANTDTNNLNLGGAGNGEVSGVVNMGAGGTNNINKVGGGTWTLSGAVSNVNGLSVSGGTMALGAGIAAAGDMAVNGAGSTLKLGGTSASAKGLTGTGGTLSGSDSGALNLTLGVGATAADPKTFSGTIANGSGGAVSLTKTGSNRQILSGTNSYTGTTTISDGQLQFSGAGSLAAGAGKITVSGASSGTVELNNVGTKTQALDLTGRTSDTFHVDNIAGDNVLSGVVALAESDTPATTPDNYNFNVTAGSLTVTNGVKVLTGGDTHADPINLKLSGDAGIGAMGAVDLGNALTANNTIVKTGTGTWSLDAATTNVKDINAKGGTLVLNSTGIGAVGGTVTIDNGAILKQGAVGAFADKTIQVDGALDLNGLAASLPGLNGAGTGSVTNSNASPAVLTITGDGSFAGNINNGPGAVSLTMNGDGKTQVLSGGGNYSGQTTVSAGTLEIRSNTALGDPAGVTQIGGTGTLALRSNTSINSAESLTLVGRANNAPAHVNNADGSNILSAAAITLQTAGSGTDNYNLNIDAGNLAITHAIDGTTSTGAASNLNLSGAAGTSGLVGEAITMKSGAANTLNKTGAGAWTLTGAVSNLTALNAAAGTLTLGSNITVAGDINVNGTLKLDGINATAQGLTGSGTVLDDSASLLTLGGASGIGDKTFSGVIADGSGTVSLSKVGDNRQILSGANTYSGETTISAGTLEIRNGSGLGATSAGTTVQGTGTLALSNGITSAEAITLAGRSGTGAHIDNISGDNTLTGAITLNNAVGGTSNFNIMSSVGTLTVEGGISGGASGSARNLDLGGAGNGVVTSGVIAMGGSGGGGVATINKDGSGTWTLNSAVTGVNEIKANEGTLKVGASADVSTVDKLFVASGATIDATAVVSDFNIVSGQTLYGSGTVVEPDAGDVVAKAGSTIDIGNGLHTDIATLSILGDMTLAADSLIRINLDPTGAGLVDLLQVSDILNIVDRAKLAFYWTAAPTALVYEFARYETLDPTSGTFAVTNAPTGYHIDYGYNDHYVALVSDIPVPAPLFLMGLGALIMGAGRRYAKW